MGLSPWSAAFHLVKVKEIYPGSDAAPNAQYIVLQLPAPGENLVGGKQIRIFDAAGTLVSTLTFPAPSARGRLQRAALPDSAGQCTIQRSFPNATRSVTFSVASVVSGKAYTPSQNHDPDGDSTGTSIVFRRH